MEDVAPEIAAELDRLTARSLEEHRHRSTLFRTRQAELAQLEAIDRRLAALEEDLQKNLDAQKLRNFGSTVSEVFAADHCPTCTQPIQDTLLAQKASARVMPIGDNIEYIRSQRAIFRRMRKQTENSTSKLERSFAIATSAANETSARLRALRQEIVAPSQGPSIAALEQRLRIETKLHALEDVEQRFEQQKAELIALADNHNRIVSGLDALPNDRLTKDDNAKLELWARLVREQVGDYGFTTFPAGEIEISPDNYRPQKEGFEIGFELSASDAIRLKWAYQLGLLELSRTTATNHPGFVIFDEPRQQETAKVSFHNLLRRSATSKKFDQQVIFATSEDRGQLAAAVKGIEHHLIPFDGPIIRRIG